MWQDPIVAETRSLREQYANQFNHDAEAIFQDILHRQKAPGKKLVSFPPRKPIHMQNVAQRTRSDRESEANHDLNRLLDEPGGDESGDFV